MDAFERLLRLADSELEDLGYTVIRFLHSDDDWEAVVRRHPGIFAA